MKPIGVPEPPPGVPFRSDPIPPEPPPEGAGALWLVRHGEVAREWHETAYGNMDVPLSQEGEQETRAVALAFGKVPVARVASSHLARALAMGRAIAEVTRAPLTVDERLREIDRGAWQGLTKREFARRWRDDAASFHADPFRWKGHAGESDEDIWQRARGALSDALGRAAGGTLVVTAHYNLIRVVTTRLVGWSPVQSFSFRNGPARALLLEPARGRWRLVGCDARDPAEILAARG